MQSIAKLSQFADRLQRLIQAASNGNTAWTDELFGELALKLFELQCEFNEPYRILCQTIGKSRNLPPKDWKEIPPVPTSAFKDLELSCLSADSRTTVFYSSGTTQHRPSRHFHNAESLRVYEASLIAAFSRRLDISRPYTVISLTPRREVAANSSLVHMFKTFHGTFGNNGSRFAGKIEEDGGWTVNVEIAKDTLLRVAESGSPVLILGTAFLFVHLLDFLDKNALSFALPRGSHILETGGYKGRSRIIPKDELHQLICESLAISPADIICEYGMSELSSQAYDLPTINPRHCRSRREEAHIDSSPQDQSLLTSAPTRTLHFPPWTRVQIISPETGREVNEGETGLIRVFDLANVFSVMAIQTEDLAIRRGDGFELLGRATPAEPRGCSLMAV